jgi:hypothetical protein
MRPASRHPRQGHKPLAEVLAQNSVPVTESGCWLWTGVTVSTGYGRLSRGRRGSYVFAHRASYQMHKGEIPAGMFVCHKCDTPTCINPDHLFLGTCAENTLDMWRKGRARPFGHPQRRRVA